MIQTVDAVSLLDRATTGVTRVLERVSPEQLGDPTPCPEWDVQASSITWPADRPTCSLPSAW